MNLSLALGGFVVLVAIACRSSTSPQSTDPCANSGTDATVSASDNFTFAPNSVTITVGQSVCWQNRGTLVHTVTDNATSGARFNGNLASGQAFVHTFGFGGSFIYHCNNHSNMTATVVVNCKPGDLVC